MSSKVIREWLAEFKALPDSELNTYASTIRNNDDLVSSLYDLFEEDLSQEVADPVCHQLFEFYRSGHEELKRFTLEMVPTLVWVYLSCISKHNKHKCGGIEACLLGIYNLEIVNKDGSSKMEQFTIPTLAMASIYHEPPSLATLALTESTLLRYHSDEPVVIATGPHPQVESINAQNRLTLLSHVLQCYYGDVANLSQRSHHALCSMASRLCKTGFDNLGDFTMDSYNLNDSNSSSSSIPQRRGVKFANEPRIALSSDMLVTILNSIYFIMFNGQAHIGNTSVEDIHTRACYELYSDVLLVTNAIRNSLRYNPSGQPQDGPMGISIALSPTSNNPAFSKHAITNASFRAKKLPDDIPISTDEDLDSSPKKASRKSSEITLPEAFRRNSDQGGQRSSEGKGSKVTDAKKKENERKKNRKVLVNSVTDDIEVPEEEDIPQEQPGAPPQYEEVVEQDKMKMVGTKLSKPLKSIMKTKVKLPRKDSDIKKRDSSDGHSPRHSMVQSSSTSVMSSSVSASTMIQSASLNGEIADPNMIQVTVARSGSRTMVDQLEMRGMTGARDIQHRRTASYPEGNFDQVAPPGRENTDKPLMQPASHSRDLKSAQNGASSGSSNGSLNTAL